jgi:predicted enzyme related to lactoylglutathione lyase
VLGWQVDDIEETLRRLAAAGILFEHYGGLDQDEQGGWRSPSGARIAWFKDPEGNVLSVTQVC